MSCKLVLGQCVDVLYYMKDLYIVSPIYDTPYTVYLEELSVIYSYRRSSPSQHETFHYFKKVKKKLCSYF